MTRFILTLSAGLFLVGCKFASYVDNPETEFWDRMEQLCGGTYDGKVTSDDAVDESWRQSIIIVGPVDCETKNQIRMPLRVGDDTSRTWILTRHKENLELRHEHYLPNGLLDPVTDYGGFTDERSSGSRVNFPADEATKNLFDREGIPQSKPNVWALENRPVADLLAYELERPGRYFRIEFDTSSQEN